MRNDSPFLIIPKWMSEKCTLKWNQKPKWYVPTLSTGCQTNHLAGERKRKKLHKAKETSISAVAEMWTPSWPADLPDHMVPSLVVATATNELRMRASVKTVRGELRWGGCLYLYKKIHSLRNLSDLVSLTESLSSIKHLAKIISAKNGR